MNRFRHAATLATLVSLLAGSGCATTGPAEVESQDQLRRQARAKYNLGIDQLSRGNNAMALRELLGAVELQPDDPWSHLAAAEAYRRMDRTEQAISHLERSLVLEPELQSARLNLSGVLIQSGAYTEAEAHARILVDDPTMPAPWRAHNNLGWSLYRQGRVEEAHRHLRLAVEFNEDYWPAMLNLGILEYERGRRLEAISLFQRVLEGEPPSLAAAEANYRLAEAYIALGQQERAVDHLVAAARTKPKGKWGRKSEQYLKLLR